MPTFEEALRSKVAAGENWLASSKRTQQALRAWFLVAEDRQQRLVVRKVAPLMHQLSLVEHVLSSDDLPRVLIGDEVGLGKTVEAGLIALQLRRSRPDLRVLYLSPARLVPNVVAEFERLGLEARRLVAGPNRDARLDTDRVVVASIQKAVRKATADELLRTGPWDLLIVDECHHLSDWNAGGGSPNAGYALVDKLLKGQRTGSGRLILLSGTPHQGHQTRFENILRLLTLADDLNEASGRLIFRTKESVRDWRGRPLFPGRDVRQPRLARLSPEWSTWYDQVGSLYDGASAVGAHQSRGRAGGWAKGQALQWVASSVDAGLGFLTRLAIRRLRWAPDRPELAEALGALRPYRGGPSNEPLAALYDRLRKQIGNLEEQEDAEELLDDEETWSPDPQLLGSLLTSGARLKREGADAEKWRVMLDLLREAGSEKVVLFCQPVETVAVVARFIEAEFGNYPSIVVGGQTDVERQEQVEAFRNPNGARYLVSSRAGGEGLNLQIARRLIHLDIPWNPMDLEQRVGRIHRFGSRETIIVETIVVPGTRESDAYRIARDKLRLIAGQLAHEDFEALFSRVMNLVPPEELSDIFTINQPWSAGGEADARLFQIVREGYDRLNTFTERFKANGQKIAQLEPGAADWKDLRDFLVANANAQIAPSAVKPIFSLKERDVVSEDVAVETLEVFGGRYVCAETEGLPCYSEDGEMLSTVGMSHSGVVELVRDHLTETDAEHLAAIRLSAAELREGLSSGDVAILFFAVQRLHITGYTQEERELSLRAFALTPDGSRREVQPGLMGALVRNISAAERQLNPSVSAFFNHLASAEEDIAAQLRAEGGQQIRIAVWPVACVLASIA
jgi:superfamily II DNA or RNA helicase